MLKNAQTPYSRQFITAGIVCELATNSEDILEIAGSCFRQQEVPSRHPALFLRFWVGDSPQRSPYWSKPYLRGLEHLAYAGFGPESALAINLRTRHGLGRLSAEVARDPSFWRRVIFPIVLTIMGPSMGIVVLHAGCVARQGEGLLLAGPSGSGKSTLSIAMTQFGFDYLSDDRTFVSLQNARLIAWRVPMPIKLRSEAAVSFSGLEGGRPGTGPRGESILEFDPDVLFPANRAAECRLSALVFLQRESMPCCVLDAMPAAEAAARLEGDMAAGPREAHEFQTQVIQSLVTRPVWRLTYGASPQDAAKELVRIFDQA